MHERYPQLALLGMHFCSAVDDTCTIDQFDAALGTVQLGGYEQECGCVVAARLVSQRKYHVGWRCVEVAGWFVRPHQRRVERERTVNRRKLLFPVGQMTDAVPAASFAPDGPGTDADSGAYHGHERDSAALLP